MHPFRRLAALAALLMLGCAAPAMAMPVVVITDPTGTTVSIGTTASAPINVSTAVTTQLIAAPAAAAVYITHFDFIAAAADNVTLEYGTGALCATGTTLVTGAYNLGANGGMSVGAGMGVIIPIPKSNAVCLVTSAATQLSGLISYTAF